MNTEKQEKKCLCRLCRKQFDESEMSEEHYPARSVGNDDIIAFNIAEYFDSLYSGAAYNEISKRINNGMSFKQASDAFFDDKLARLMYPHGRTARTLCQRCNTFLGKYDEAYLRFFNADGNEKTIKGFQKETKNRIIS